jgi:hypothetical protein
MPEVHVIVGKPEEADDGIAEFWCAGEIVAETTFTKVGCTCPSTRAPTTSRG